jgi:hypothetical protein
MREGMKCKPVLSKLEDGTLMIKEIKWWIIVQKKYLKQWMCLEY